MRTRRTSTEHRGARPAVPARAQAPGAAAVMALQRSAGNAAVARMLQERAAVAREPAPAVGEPEKRYDFEITIDQRPLKFHQLTPEQTVASLRSAWRLAHNMLDAGRAETQRLVERREEQRTAVFWSDVLGGVEVPDRRCWSRPAPSCASAGDGSTSTWKARSRAVDGRSPGSRSRSSCSRRAPAAPGPASPRAAGSRRRPARPPSRPASSAARRRPSTRSAS